MKVNYNYRYTPEELCRKIVDEWQIKNVAVDFDLTLVETHTRNWGFEPATIPRHEYVIELVKLLLNKGVQIGIATFCYRTQDLIREFCNLVFGQKFSIRSSQYRHSGKSGMVESLFEKFYLTEDGTEYMEGTEIDILDECVLIDDDISNIKQGLRQNLRGILIDIQRREIDDENEKQIFIDAIPFNEIEFKPSFIKPVWKGESEEELFRRFQDYIIKKHPSIYDKQYCKYYKLFEKIYFDSVQLNCETYGWKIDTEYLKTILYCGYAWDTEMKKRVFLYETDL